MLYEVITIDLSFDELKLGGSSFAQVLNKLGDEVPTVTDALYFKDGFNAIQSLINKGFVLAGHDISAGGMVTALLEMCFANTSYGLNIDLSLLVETDLIKVLFSENPGVLIQVEDLKAVDAILADSGIQYVELGAPTKERRLSIVTKGQTIVLDIDKYRDIWYKTSYLLDRKQSGEKAALARFENYKKQDLTYHFPAAFNSYNFV